VAVITDEGRDATEHEERERGAEAQLHPGNVARG
jgi:hypothetical protein